jgi:hypothetical protein
VDQCNGHRFGTAVSRHLERVAEYLRIKGVKERTVGCHPGTHLDHRLGERLGFVDFEREQVGARLVANSNQVSKAFVRHENAPASAPLEERIGGQSGPHPDLAGWDRIVRPEPQERPDTFERCLIGGEHLGNPEGTRVPVAVDAIRERPATVDPELVPGSCLWHRGWHRSTAADGVKRSGTI